MSDESCLLHGETVIDPSELRGSRKSCVSSGLGV